MPRLVWLTDIHLNFVESVHLQAFLDQVDNVEPDHVLIGGDIAEAHDVASYLVQLQQRWQVPLYFVLGNHDFYHSSIADVRYKIAECCRQHPALIYLSQTESVQLTADVALVGHDGWADGRMGDYHASPIMLNDYQLIQDLAKLTRQQRRSKLNALGDEAAGHVHNGLSAALTSNTHVYLLTHVPPFREACLYDGRIADDDWAPHFTCQAVGHVIMEIMPDHPNCELTVLCGHSHHKADIQPLPNVHVLTGGATYGHPAIAATWDLE